MNRRVFRRTAPSAGAATALTGQTKELKRILLRSSWPTVNIGDIARTPGLLALLEKHRAEAEASLWPSSVDCDAEQILRARFPELKTAQGNAGRLLQIGHDLPATRADEAKVRAYARERMTDTSSNLP